MSQNTTVTFPQSAIAYLHTSFQCGCTGRFTGFLIGADLMMTAAQSVICPKHGKPFRQLTARFGYTADKQCAAQYDGRWDVYHGANFRKSDGTCRYAVEDAADDYAWLKLSERIGDQVGWFGLKDVIHHPIPGNTLQVTGYSAGYDAFRSGEARVMSASRQSGEIFPTCSAAESGFTGAPLFTSDGYVMGVLGCTDYKPKCQARGITSDLIERMHTQGLFGNVPPKSSYRSTEPCRPGASARQAAAPAGPKSVPASPAPARQAAAANGQTLTPVQQAAAQARQIAAERRAAQARQDAAASAPKPVTADEKRLVQAASDPNQKVTVKAPGDFPYSAIARIETTFKCGCKGCFTGFLVGPDRVMSAAMSVVCYDHGKELDDVVLYFGYKAKDDYALKYDGSYQAAWGTDFIQPDGSVGYSQQDASNDFSYIWLKDDRVGDRLGWFGMKALDDQPLLHSQLWLAGYHQDTGELRLCLGGLESTQAEQFLHTIVRSGGYNGAPIYTDDYHVVGIHIAGGDSRGSIAMRVTQPMINMMRKETGLPGSGAISPQKGDPDLPLWETAPADGWPKVSITNDRNVPVRTPSERPYSAIAKLDVQYQCGCHRRRTGFLVEADLMMTAAHCVICAEHGKPFRQITATFSRKGFLSSTYTYSKTYDMHAGTDFTKTVKAQNGIQLDDMMREYAYLKLAERVGDKVGWFGLTSLTDKQLAAATLRMAGYHEQTGKLLTGVSRVNEIVQTKLFDYDPGDEGGLEGCPIFNAEGQVVGIHLIGGRDDDGSQNAFALRITCPIIDRIYEI